MEFTAKLKDFSQRIEKLKDGVQTEEATKTSLVMPFLICLDTMYLTLWNFARNTLLM